MGRRSSAALAGLALGLGLLVVGCGTAAAPRGSGPEAAPTSPAPAAGSATATGEPSTAPVPGPAGAAPAGPVTTPRGLRPVRVTIPAIGVDASMTDLGIADDGSIEVPSDPDQVGWLDTTPAPGQQGPAVLAGHVDSDTGPAVFEGLSTLAVGDPVEVTLRDGTTVTFTVDGVRTYPQDHFPTADVYGPVPGPVLRLITCGGDYVRTDGGYQSNVVVYAS